MAIPSINEALMSKSAALKLLQSGEVTAEQRGELTARWGSDFVIKAMTIDGNDYEIDDVSYDTAKNVGRQAAKDKTGHDGSKRGIVGTATSAVGGAAVALGGFASGFAGKVVSSGINAITGTSTTVQTVMVGGNSTTVTGAGGALEAKVGGTKKLGAYATVILAAAIAAKYYAGKPNKDQYNAAMDLMREAFPEAEATLYDAQNNAVEASECVTELSEEAEGLNEEAGEDIEENKALFDFYRDQFTAIIEKVNSGEPLTPDEKALMEELMPLLEELGITIEEVQEETTDEVADLYDEMGEYQDRFDEVGEAIAEVEGMTSFAESFDEGTRTNTYIEGVSQGLNAAGATRAAIQLSAGPWWQWAFAAIGYAAAASSGYASAEQISWAGQLGSEIDARRDVQSLGEESFDVYSNELDNYAGNIELVEDLEIEMPEDMEVPEAPVVQDDGSTIDPLAAAAAGVDDDDKDDNSYSPLGGTGNNGSTGGTNRTNGTNGDEDDPNKKKTEDEE